MAEDTKEYVVTASSVGVVTGVNPRDGIDIVRYHSKGETVQLDGESAKRLLGLSAVQDPEELRKAQEREQRRQEAIAKADREAAEAEVERAEAERAEQEKELAASNEGTGDQEPQRLTEKQALQKEAGELGLDTEGTIPELRERIDAKKAADAAGSGS